METNLNNNILLELDQAFQLLKAARLRLKPTRDFLGRPALEACLGSFSILLPG